MENTESKGYVFTQAEQGWQELQEMPEYVPIAAMRLFLDTYQECWMLVYALACSEYWDDLTVKYPFLEPFYGGFQDIGLELEIRLDLVDKSEEQN